MSDLLSKLKLKDFNNLTKVLSFNIYDICFAATPDQVRGYIEYIDEEYNAERLTNILKDVANIIGAKILNIAHQDYDPQGASVTMLIAEEQVHGLEDAQMESPGPLPDAVVAHRVRAVRSVRSSTFRADIDVSTCGTVSPLKALNYLIHSFDSDIVTMDYRVRGFTRDVYGNKHYIDHDINSIQNFISQDTKNIYQMIDVNVYQENIFHTKMMLKELELDNYLFGVKSEDLAEGEHDRIKKRLETEMLEIFYGRNID